MSDSKRIAGGHRLGALWQTQTKEGLVCYTGHIVELDRKIQIGVFPRKEKKEGQPDYDIVISDPYDQKTGV